MAFFGRSSSGGSGNGPTHRPFSIDDAFDIPEEDAVEDEEDETDAAHASIIRNNGQLRLEAAKPTDPKADPTSNGAPLPHVTKDPAGSTDSASLIPSGSGDAGGGGGHGYYAGPPPVKYWWKHPKIRSNPKVVMAACMLVFLGVGEGRHIRYGPSFTTLILFVSSADDLRHRRVLRPLV